MAAMTTMDLDLELELALAPGRGADSGPDVDDIDPYADPLRAWCPSSDGPALVLDGFCEHCGACDHDLC
ncbi:hypothetical protein MF406_06330 [Georgenia sp. TF02-10]|uniref:hypothetical protein n=1 Tax=Georgenia sp. TF02-10 TaxID=2917725 RepID=UPI001FA6DA12|nr:hypothetical protein [Georgenia sp. TF02-10]UNX55847.1 hypothetical protein MF406_06330 [Georgenia sp. TF02-10]